MRDELLSGLSRSVSPACRDLPALVEFPAAAESEATGANGLSLRGRPTNGLSDGMPYGAPTSPSTSMRSSLPRSEVRSWALS
jgi:hypothetical protein